MASQLMIDEWTLSIKEETWKKDLLCLRTRKRDNETLTSVEIVSSFHAHCVPCQHHIYTRSDLMDVASLFAAHVNSQQHVIQLRSLPANKPIFEHAPTPLAPGGTFTQLWKCNACSLTLEATPYQTHSRLEVMIEDHTNTLEHVRNADLVREPTASMLVGIAMTRPFVTLVTAGTCNVCNVPIAGVFYREKHIKSAHHLDNLERMIESTRGVTVQQLRDVKSLNLLFEREKRFNVTMLKAFQCQSTVNLVMQLNSEALVMNLFCYNGYECFICGKEGEEVHFTSFNHLKRLAMFTATEIGVNVLHVEAASQITLILNRFQIYCSELIAGKKSKLGVATLPSNMTLIKMQSDPLFIELGSANIAEIPTQDISLTATVIPQRVVPKTASQISTEGCIRPIENESLNQEISPVKTVKPQQDVARRYIEYIKNEAWKENLLNVPPNSKKWEVDALASVVTISSYLAYCVPCQLHIYTRSDATDISSMFINHVNSQQHVILLRSLPASKPVFEPIPAPPVPGQTFVKLWKCNACSESLAPTSYQSYKSLESMIADHSSTPDHELNVHLILQPIASMLIGIAMTPPFMDLVTDLECRLCNVSVPGPFHREQHVKTTLHLDYVEHVLATEHGLTIDQISQDDKLFQLFEKLSQVDNHSETLVLTNVAPDSDKSLTLPEQQHAHTNTMEHVTSVPPHRITQGNENDPKLVASLEITSQEPEVARVVPAELEQEAPLRKEAEVLPAESSNEVATRCDDPVITAFSSLSSQDQLLVERSLKFVNKKEWKYPHPDSVLHRKEDRSGLHYDEYIDIVNDFHAYCRFCQTHIYSRSDPEDISSQHIDHINSNAHRLHLKTLPKTKKIFTKCRGGSMCNACNEILTPVMKPQKMKLTLEIGKHWFHRTVEFRLLGIAMSPIMKSEAVGKCFLCHTDVFVEFNNEEHVVSDEHLNALGVLRGYVDIYDDEELKDFFAEQINSGFVAELRKTAPIDSSLTSEEETLVKCSVEFVANNEWKNMQKPHPSSVVSRMKKHAVVHCADKTIDVINHYHAYCMACQIHIYSRSDYADVSSLHIPHVNSQAHRFYVQSHPKNGNIFQSDDVCNVCPDRLSIGHSRWMKPIYKKTEMSLKDEIEAHVLSDDHEYGAVLMTDPRESRLIGIGMSPVMKTQVNNPCGICLTNFVDQFGNGAHIKSAEHLNALEDLLKSIDIFDDEKLAEFFAGQVPSQAGVEVSSVKKESSLSNAVEDSKTTVVSSLSNKHSVKRSVKFVETGVWKKWQQPHPDSVTQRSSDVMKFPDETIDVVNDYHAYCVACQHHIYSRSDPHDESSLHIPHIFGYAHRFNMRKLPKTAQIFEVDGDSAHCNACQQTANKLIKNAKRTLKEEIEKHVDRDEHEWNAALLTIETDSRLVGIGMSPIMKINVTSPCPICHAGFSDQFGNEAHIKSSEHLDALEDLLKGIDIFDSDQIKEFFEKQLINGEGNDNVCPAPKNPVQLTCKIEKAGVPREHDFYQAEDILRPAAMSNHMATDTPNEPVLTGMSLSNVVLDSKLASLSGKELKRVRNSVMFVERDTWKKWQLPHPDSVAQRSTDVIPFHDPNIDVVNDYHAYCVACQLHIFSRSNPDDIVSMNITHIASNAHRFQIRALPKTANIFETRGESTLCNVCLKLLPLQRMREKNTLKEAIEAHVDSKAHLRNAELMNDKTESRLVAIGMSPVMKNTVSSPCPLCHASFSDKYGNEAHIKSPDHLDALDLLLEGLDIFDSDQIKDFFALRILDEKAVNEDGKNIPKGLESTAVNGFQNGNTSEPSKPATSTGHEAVDVSKIPLPGLSTVKVASEIPLPSSSAVNVNEAVAATTLATNVAAETPKKAANDKSYNGASKVNVEAGKPEGNSVMRNLKACVSLAKYLRATPFFIHPYLEMTKAVDNRNGQEAEVVIPSSELPEEVEVSCRTSDVVKEAIPRQEREENTVEEEEVALPSPQEAVDALLTSEEAEDARENWDVTLEVAAELGGECSAASGDYEQSSGSSKAIQEEIDRLPSLSQDGAILDPSSNYTVDSSHAQPGDHQHSKNAEQPSGYVTRVLRLPRITHPASLLWKELHRPHPGEVTSREPVAVKKTTRLRWIDVINGFHAYCLPCRFHIFSRSDPFDVCSYFHAHLNTAQHRLHVQLLAPARPVFQHDPSDTLGPDTWLCNACGHFLLPQEQDPATPLRLLVGTHLDSLEHEETARLMDDPVLSLLVAAACTPMLMAEIRLDVCRKHCRLCNSYFWDTVTTDQHIKTLPHLSNVRRVLETGFRLNIDEIVNSNQNVRDLVKLLTFFPQ